MMLHTVIHRNLG